MALEDIIEKIKEETREEILRIKEDTDKKITEIIDECERECESIRKEATQEGERIAAEIRNRMIIEENLAARKNLLAGRTKLIEEVFKRVEQEICRDDERYRNFLKEQIYDAVVYGTEKVVLAGAVSYTHLTLPTN